MQPLAGVWSDDGSLSYGYMADSNDDVWHFGAARVWSRPVRARSYGELPKVCMCDVFRN